MSNNSRLITKAIARIRATILMVDMVGQLWYYRGDGLIRNIGKRCGLYVHPHLLRKTVATIALGKGMPIDQVREMLGHESIATTTIYAQTHGDEIKRSHAKFV